MVPPTEKLKDDEEERDGGPSPEKQREEGMREGEPRAAAIFERTRLILKPRSGSGEEA